MELPCLIWEVDLPPETPGGAGPAVALLEGHGEAGAPLEQATL
jgi:hypothetical protein